ncbi:hypothetical protein GXP67_11645 [Rhodocytophaga rosea]|uniref:Uncharacterized protein n=1 Tax=Rhodocytophaga rosea TaxID=2704465 RepID=A0A6C0GGV7_9BACT|nr:hypothetical protein [Rhodocytophaga rosea]QHT67246.1 hypothetical protein GXP67_11645 [Rhodocytophaga rosea]
MDTISNQTKDELFLKVRKQIAKAKAIIAQSRKTVEQAKQQIDRFKEESDTYLIPIKNAHRKSLSS